jgi:coenzyme F420-reducing hydrogenase delta subunit
MSGPSTIVVFVCKWGGLSCIETAAQKRLTFPSLVKIVRVSCLSRVHTGLMLKAFELGADGVMLLGCDSRSCHFGIEEDLVDRNVQKTQQMLSLLGIDKTRLAMVRLPHGDAVGFIKRLNDFVEQFTRVGA